MAMKEVNLKGTPINGLVEFVKSELSPQQYLDVLAKIPAEQQKYFSGHMLAHELVPVSVVNKFTELAAEERKEPLKAFAKRAGRYGAEIGLKTVYKFLLLVLSIEGVLKKAPLMWTRVYDGGVIAVESGDGKASITVTEFPAHPAVCGRITGWFEVIGERAGAKELRLVHDSCVAEGGKVCRWSFTWKA
jgi:hypothetical protein